MAMGTHANEQAPSWIPATELPVSPGHPFYLRLNTVLDAIGFDRFRVQDVDFGGHNVVVRDVEGDKDRVAVLPRPA